MHMAWLAGLRGAVCYALAHMLSESVQNENALKEELILATTAITVLTTTFLLGGLTPCCLAWLRIPVNVDLPTWSVAGSAHEKDDTERASESYDEESKDNHQSEDREFHDKIVENSQKEAIIS